jgi:transcription antitermination factor NusG
MDLSKIEPVVTARWLVVHTLARCEKKLITWAQGEGLVAELPTYRTVHRYRGKVVHFDKVLFPGYAFLRAEASDASMIQQNRNAARVLVPPDMEEFDRQIREILAAVGSGLEMRPISKVQPGVRVQIIRGPLRGFEGCVERLDEPLDLVLRLDFISQAASVRMARVDVEVI